jgi:hypothetical protein
MSRSRGRRQNRPAAPEQTRTAEPIRRGELIELGELAGQTREPLTASFKYFGEEYRVNPDLSELDVIDFLEGADLIEENDPQSIVMMKSFVRRNLHPDDFEDFWETVREHRQTIQEVMALMWKLIEGVSGNPTGQPSGSSAGRPVTTVSLPDDALRPAATTVGGDLRGRYLQQIERLEAMGANGVAMAAQVAVAAEARGVDVNRVPVPS